MRCWVFLTCLCAFNWRNCQFYILIIKQGMRCPSAKPLYLFTLYSIVYTSEDNYLAAQSMLVSSTEINSKNGLISSFVQYQDNSPHQCQPFCQCVMWPGGPPDTGHWLCGSDGQICWWIHMSSVWEMWLLLTACLFSFHLAGANPWAPPQDKAATMQAAKHTA